MKAKSKLDTVNKILAVILVITFVALILVVALYKGDTPEATDANVTTEDVAVIDEFVAGTYGGKEFATMDDVVNYYVECYNYTKTLTAQYTDPNGATITGEKLLGEEALEIKNILVEGNSNSMIDGLVPGIAGGLFTGGLKSLPPSGGIVAENDKIKDGTIDVTTSLLTPEDVLAANIVDNGDGTVDVTIQPKSVILSMPGEDSQGKFFNTLGDISSVVESISVLSFSSGTIQDNFVVNYIGGTGTVKIDTATGEILSGDYTMNVHVDVQHANVTVLKDKSASLDIVYTNHFPASDEYFAEKGYAKQ